MSEPGLGDKNAETEELCKPVLTDNVDVDASEKVCVVDNNVDDNVQGKNINIEADTAVKEELSKNDNSNNRNDVAHDAVDFIQNVGVSDQQSGNYVSQDDVDFIQNVGVSDQHSVSDDEPTEETKLHTNINPIDLVLQEEIGDQTTLNNGGDNSDGRKLTFSVEDDKVNNTDDTEQSPAEFRNKVLDTIFLFWTTTTMGLVYGQMGPALPDLQFLVGASLQEATWVFTGFAIGYLGGCLLSGLIQDRCNPRLMLFLYTFGTAVTIGALPWLPVLAAMVAIRVINGICIGGQDTGVHSMLFAIWAKDGGPFIQMTHVLTAVGGILAPLITQPFVSQSTDGNIQLMATNDTNLTNATFNTTSFNTTSTLPDTINITETLVNTTVIAPLTISRTTKIHYAFLITGILVVTAAVPFLINFLQRRRTIKAVRQYSNESVDRNKLPKNIKRLILCLLGVNSFIATAYIDLFPSFLTTFVMQQVSWSQKSASTITALYFAMYALGNFIGVFILAYISSTQLFVISYISSALMILGVLLSVLFNQTELIWITVALAGLTMSGILPTLFTWTQEHVTPITARLASMLLITGSAGVMVNPLLLGYMMEQLSPLWFIYLSLGETVLCAILFATVFTLSRIYSAQKSTKAASKKEAMDESIQEEEDLIAEGKTKIYPRGTLYGI